MAKFKVEVEKILENGVCPFGFHAGETFEFDMGERLTTFPEFCGWAYHEMFPVLVALHYGTHLPFDKSGNTARITCSDSNNPVVFCITKMK